MKRLNTLIFSFMKVKIKMQKRLSELEPLADLLKVTTVNN